ncbi:MAG: tetratricopeptide repeat protein [Dysgonamonadaceae bacterium]|jgi:tetratricopeptide (TPR) repeat protein|nr:tetratricopeptide repeat protein [Dysgonamonadaceae bacterium]MDD3308955.1 tetratricopeptide repeat protein [Dysgonamonadaceae bacterium]MDD3900809.1 tetratricopeptide repeat protein [Dysgonamonadaceae bacterium]MDD4398075.1 tetratricopeptide repeat protein [Dysgonamonadaceae bacterium]
MLNYFAKVFISVVCILTTLLFPTQLNAQKLGDTVNFQLDENTQRTFDYYFYSALNSKAQGHYDQAIDYFQQCYAIDSTNANVLIELGTYYNVLNEKTTALSFIEKAVNYDPNNYYYNMMLAGLSKEQGKRQNVIEIYKHLLNIYPQKVELFFELANAYADNGDLQEAIDALNELQKSMGVTDIITYSKFRIYSMMNKKDEAFKEIEAIIEKNPDNPQYLILLGDLYIEDNQNDKALKYYKLAEKIDSENPALILSFVNYYEKVGDRVLAEKEMRKAIYDKNVSYEDKLQLVTRYVSVLKQNKQNTSDANPLFDSLLEQYPNNTQINLIYGGVLALQDDKQKAIEQFQIFTDANPGDPSGYENLLRIYIPENNMNKVVEISTMAIKNIPTAPQFYFYLGGAKSQQNKYNEALKVFEDGIKNATMPNSTVESDFYGQIGDLNHYLGNDEKAFECYEKALKLNPQNLPVLNNYSYYLSLQKRDLDKAEQMSGITIKAEPTNPTYLDTYGWILFEQNSFVMAKIYIEKAIEYGAKEPSAEVYEHYGDVLYKLDEKEKAIQQWQIAKKLGSESKTLDKKIKTGEYIEAK